MWGFPIGQPQRPAQPEQRQQLPQPPRPPTPEELMVMALRGEGQYSQAFQDFDPQEDAIKQQMEMARMLMEDRSNPGAQGPGASGVSSGLGGLSRAIRQVRGNWMAQEGQEKLGGLGRRKSESSAQKFALTNALKAREADADKTKRSQDIAEGLRKEFMSNKTTLATQVIDGSYKKLLAASKMPSAAGDLSMIFNYMKILDPGASVMEGDVANAQNAAGVPSQVRAMYNRAMSGERLSPEHRADFMKQATGQYGAQLEQFNQFATEFGGLSERLGVSPKDVVLNLGFGLPSAKGGEAPPISTSIQIKEPLPRKKIGATTYEKFGPGPNDWREAE
jgi:hypothetical protein